MKQLIIVANGGMGAKCLALVLATNDLEIACVYYDEAINNSELLRLCRDNGLQHREFNSLIREADTATHWGKIDYGINVNSRRIFPSEIVKAPRYGFINFHNSYLPEYRGLNVCSWAILNGESEHGATWHWLDTESGIDTGAILAQERFEISPNETAATLILKSIKMGIRIFPNVLDILINGSVAEPSVRPTSTKLYLRREQPNGGMLPLSEGFDAAWRFLRALDFRPFPNDFVVPRIIIGGELYEVLAYRGVPDQAKRTTGKLSIERCWSGLYLSGGTLWLPKLRHLATGQIVQQQNAG